MNHKNDNYTNVNEVIRNNKVLKRKYTEDEVSTERYFSEGEISSSFETVSSVDSSISSGNLSLLGDGSNSEDNFNVIVQIENELAYRKVKKPEERNCHRENWTSLRWSHRKDYNSNRFIKRSHSRTYSKEKKNDSSSENKFDKYNRKKYESNSTEHLRNRTSHDRKTEDSNRKSRCSSSRSRHSRSNEHRHRHRSSTRITERPVRCRSSSCKDRSAQSRHSNSFDKHSSNLTRSFSPKKRRTSSRNPVSVWNRLESRRSPASTKEGEVYKDKRDSTRKHCRKRERTPFFVEFERKLKEEKRLKDSKEESASGFKDQTSSVEANDAAPMQQTSTALYPNQSFSSTFGNAPVPIPPGVYPLQYQPMPLFSVDHLPLVAGPTGLPVHITATGEQIPHDMDGKRIPVGPNGFYLPVDSTGRLFPHVISPMNQIIPIHMTDDGVLRLPNSEPVPFGPCHQLPVNVDGNFIFIGPDSKPLYPCPNLPRGRPAVQFSKPSNLLNTSNTFGGENPGAQPTVLVMPETENREVAQTQSEQKNDQLKFQTSEVDVGSSDLTQNPPEESNKDMRKNDEKIPEEKGKDNPNCMEVDEKVDGSPSKGGVEKLTPVNQLQKKAVKDHALGSHSDKTLDLDEMTGELVSSMEQKKSSSEKMDSNTEEDPGFLEIVCGNKSYRIPTPDLDSDDPIVKKTEEAIKSLSERNYKPPVFGRFIITDILSGHVAKEFPNESPLFRNRIKLPFVTPNAKDFYYLKPTVSEESSKVTFKFLPQKSEKEERTWSCKSNRLRNVSARKFPVFTFDFAVQCDFTSIIINKLNSKIKDLEMEVVRLKEINANLLDDCKNAQANNEKKSDELRKAVLEINERKCEIQALKVSLEKQQ